MPSQGERRSRPSRAAAWLSKLDTRVLGSLPEPPTPVSTVGRRAVLALCAVAALAIVVCIATGQPFRIYLIISALTVGLAYLIQNIDRRTR
jgi:hypothetical protein